MRRADELLRGTTWILERAPDRYGTRISQWDDLWVIPAADVFEKRYAIFYSFDDKHVHLWAIRESEDGTTEGGL